MNIGKQKMQQAKYFAKQLKGMQRKYYNQTLSDHERNNALLELRILNEQLDGFSVEFGSHFQGKMKTEALNIIGDIEKMCAELVSNLEETIPASHYL